MKFVYRTSSNIGMRILEFVSRIFRRESGLFSRLQHLHLLISFASIHHDDDEWLDCALPDSAVVIVVLKLTTGWRADNDGESAI